MKNHSKGFTLIELLVVISIIGLLSSVVLASLNTAREKGRIAAAIKFAVSNYRGLGADAVLSMNFDDQANMGKDESVISNNDGSITGTITSSVDTFNTQGRSINVTTGAYINVPNQLGIGLSSFTVAHWVKTPNVSTQLYTLANAPGGHGWRFGLDVGRITALIGNSAGVYSSLICGTKTVNDDKWHYIAGSFDRVNRTFSCYIDGAFVTTVGFSTVSTDNIENANPVRIGRAHCCTPGFTGLIDNVNIYKQALTSREIQEIYAKQLVERNLAGIE